MHVSRDDSYEAPGSTAALPGEAETAGEPAARMLAPGQVVAGRYRVEAFLARGAMGEVFRAHDLLLGQALALKAIRPTLAGDPAALDRFRREIQLGRRVTHRHVCRVFDVLPHRTAAGEVPVISMELLEGETLARRLRRAGPMTPADALPIVEQLAAGLTAMHDAGVIHRDLKTSNILIVAGQRDERVVIADLGLARLLPTRDDEDGSSMTGAGVLVGTPAYVAPEQISGGTVTPATDVYALGVILYEMVTGRVPFSAETPLATATRRLVEDPPPPRRFAPALPGRWQRVLLRCLERRPERRYASAAAVVEALRHGPRRARAGLAALVAVAVATGVVAARARGGGGALAPAPAPTEHGRWEPDVSHRAQPLDPALHEPWRRALAQHLLAERPAAEATLRRVVAAEPAFAPAHGELALLALELGDDDLGAAELARASALAAADPELPRAERLRLEAAVAWSAKRFDEMGAAVDALWRLAPGLDTGFLRVGYLTFTADDERVRHALADVRPLLVGVPAPLLDGMSAHVATLVSDFRTAAEAADRQALLARAGGYPGLLAAADDILQYARASLGDLANLEQPEEESLRLALATLDVPRARMMLTARASRARARGDLAGMLDALDRARPSGGGLEDVPRQALAMRVEGHGRRGELDEARAALAEWRRRLALQPHWTNDAGHDVLTALLAELTGDVALAHERLAAVVAAARAHNHSALLADTLVAAARVAAARGESAEARAALEEARTTRRTLGYYGGVGEVEVELLELAGGPADRADALAAELARRGAGALADRARVVGAETALAGGRRAEAAARLVELRAPPRQGVPLAPRIAALSARVAPSPEAAARLASASRELAARGLIPAALGLRIARAEVLAALGRVREAGEERAAVAVEARQRGLVALEGRALHAGGP